MKYHKAKTSVSRQFNLYAIILAVLIVLSYVLHRQNWAIMSDFVTVLAFLLLIGSYFILNKYYIAPLHQLGDALEKLLAGSADEKINEKIPNEMGLIGYYINRSNLYLKRTVDLIENLAKGQRNENITLIDEEKDLNSANNLTKALETLQERIVFYVENEHEQKWVAEGLSKFIEILRSNQEDLNKLYDTIIANLVRYLNAHQGGLFLVEEDEKEQIVLNMVSCYAYNRKKFLKKQVHIGEGLLGQSYLEKEAIYLTDIPHDYAEISSGIGEAKPRSVLIVPLKINDTVYGMLEIASFYELPQYRVNFVVRLAENIASTIASTQNVDKIRKLLTEAELQREQMRAQEEEMRQNVEELTSTQEEIRRKQDEMEKLNQRLLTNESVLKKALLQARDKEQGMEKQKTNVEEKQANLEVLNQRLKENELILKSAFEQGKEREQEIAEKVEKMTENEKILQDKIQILETKLKQLENKNQKNK